MRALITGGKGFVGHWLAAHLKDSGDEAVVTDIETDITDGAALRKVVGEASPEAIYHLAALTHVGESWENPSQVLKVNVLGTAEVLAAARTLPSRPVVLVVSSAEVYGAVTPQQLPLREDTPTAPATRAASVVPPPQTALWLSPSRSMQMKSPGRVLPSRCVTMPESWPGAATVTAVPTTRRSGITALMAPWIKPQWR